MILHSEAPDIESLKLWILSTVDGGSILTGELVSMFDPADVASHDDTRESGGIGAGASDLGTLFAFLFVVVLASDGRRVASTLLSLATT